MGTSEDLKETSGEEESVFWAEEMLADGDLLAHLNGEGVRQRFYRTRVIPRLEGAAGEQGGEEEEEEAVLPYGSLLDSILVGVDWTDRGPVEFPELGRCLQEVGSEPSPTALTLAPGSWDDNWRVHGLTTFEDQTMFWDTQRRRVIPEVVPFLVPQGLREPGVCIGGQQIDQVSELSEQSDAASEFSELSSSSLSSAGEEQRRPDDTIEVFLTEQAEEGDGEGSVQEDGRPGLLEVKAWPDQLVTAAEGDLLCLQCTVAGLRPIGGARPGATLPLLTALSLLIALTSSGTAVLSCTKEMQ
jgi:hypothetical protein